MRTLYSNGNIITMDPTFPQAEALVTEENLIVGLGALEEMKELAGTDANQVDMKGGSLFPGFNETHNHLSMYAIFNEYAYLGDCTNIADLQNTITSHYADTEQSVYIAYAYDDTKLTDGRQITRHDLDALRTDIPVIVYHVSAHLGFLNTKALEVYGINADTPVPVGGEIHFEEGGMPTGRLDEFSWFNLLENFPTPDAKTYRPLLEKAIRNFNAQGITGIHDAGIGLEGNPQMVVDTFKKLAEEDKLNVRSFLSPMADNFDKMEPQPLTEFNDMVTVGGVKLFIDGSIQVQTAALLEPYHGSYNWVSDLVMSKEDFTDKVIHYHKAGHHLSIHGNGDAAIEAIITAIEKAQEIAPRPNARHLLIHCQMAHRSHLKRMKKASIIPTFFAMHVHNWGDRHRELFLGEERASRIDPAGEAEQLGLPFAFHVDTPVLKPQVLPSIETAVTRMTSGGKVLGAEQRTTQYGAIAAYTSMASLCSHSEKVRGTLTVGKFADMVLLDTDISTCPANEISQAKVLQTITDGRLVYEAEV